jgi:branched-chain amino acid transport system substrate-binding protein
VRRASLVVAGAALLLSSCLPGPRSTIRIGALFPMSGPQASLSAQEYAGVRMAREFVNADGGIHGTPIELVARDLTTREDADARVAELQYAGVQAIIGTYSSSLSLPASGAAARRGLLYWEAGAVADQVTGRGLPLVFRVGASGGNLGSMSSHFTASVIAPRLNRPPAALRMAIVEEDDAYGRSVGDAAQAQAGREGIPVVATIPYLAAVPDWPRVLDAVERARPDILVLASYIPDGVSFRRAMLARGLHVEALIGSTMAECGPEFGALLGADAIGVFASDRPTAGFNPGALNPVGRAAYDRFAAAYRDQRHAEPTEEALAGFAAGWALFHYVLAAAGSDLSPTGMANAARSLDLPLGSLANGAGIEFAASDALMGQNLRAASVIWQWQGVRHSVTVYPPVFATGVPILIPLPR